LIWTSGPFSTAFRELERRRPGQTVDDATNLADLLRMGRLPEAWITPPEVRDLRELTRYRHDAGHLAQDLVRDPCPGQGQLPGPLAARGRTPSGGNREGQSTARHRGGTALARSTVKISECVRFGAR
jgi:hypothetical protein